jgi:histidinol-phosphate aminotransferase
MPIGYMSIARRAICPGIPEYGKLNSINKDEEMAMSIQDAPRLCVAEKITRLIPYRPGKPIEEVQRELGLKEVIKLASNENPLGPSPAAAQAIREAVSRANLYPDGACFRLKSTLSSYLNISEDHLIIGNGSDELIQLIGITFLSPGDELLQADPAFARYESSATLNEAVCVKVPLLNWTHDLPAMAKKLSSKTRLIYITNPNNPTGTIVTEREVRDFMEQVPERAIVLFDEAYKEYTDHPEFPDAMRLVREGRNVIILRTFSKMYGLAGLRVGYGVTTPEIVNFINQPREPFNVNLLAQTGAAAALGDDEHVRKTKETNEQGKKKLYEAFEGMGLTYTPTEANFVWVDTGMDCNMVFQKLLLQGVITRTGDIFDAPTYLRVTIGTPDENEKFIAALKKVLQGQV